MTVTVSFLSQQRPRYSYFYQGKRSMVQLRNMDDSNTHTQDWCTDYRLSSLLRVIWWMAQSELKRGTMVALLPEVWRYRVRPSTGWPGGRILRLAHLICNFRLSAAARTTLWADRPLDTLCMFLERYAARNATQQAPAAVTTHQFVSQTVIVLFCTVSWSF